MNKDFYSFFDIKNRIHDDIVGLSPRKHVKKCRSDFSKNVSISDFFKPDKSIKKELLYAGHNFKIFDAIGEKSDLTGNVYKLIDDNTHDDGMITIKDKDPRLGIKLAVSRNSVMTSYNAPDLSYIDYLRIIQCHIRNMEYNRAYDVANSGISQLKEPRLILFFGYILALLFKDEAQVLKIFLLISNSRFNKEDIPQLFRLLTELKLLTYDQYESARVTLFSVNFFRENLPILADMTKEKLIRLRVIPKLFSQTSRQVYEIISDEYNSVSKVYDSSDNADNKSLDVAKELPDLIPVSEVDLSEIQPRNEVDLEKDANMEYLLKTINNRDWTTSIHIATYLLKKSPENDEILQHRAYALMKYGRYFDAIRDITKAIEANKTVIRLRMRAAMWLALGDRESAKLDEDLVNSKH